MARIQLKRKLRPIRFAFLVAPNNLRELTRAFQINTVLWGGQYNIVVPAWNRCPEQHHGEGSARKVVRGLLDAAEPDFVVSGQVDVSQFDVAKERVVKLDDMFKKPGLPGGGLSVMPHYQWLYETEWKFQ